MLDDLKLIHERDPEDALGITEKQWQQLEMRYELGSWSPSVEIRNVVHAGMGGSALWAYLGASWPGFKVPFEVSHGYDLPSYVNSHTLVIASSYSGNTEETLASLKMAEEKKASILIISSGGKLTDIAKDKDYPLIELPKIGKPRYGALYGLKGLVTVADHLGIAAEPHATKELIATADFLKQSISAWVPTVPTAQNKAKQLALEVIGKSAVIYGGPLLGPAAHKWKISFNESSKNVAWEYTFPEFNHNEFTGWTSQPTQKPYTIFYLLSSFDNDRIKKRFELSDKLLSGKWPSPERVTALGDTKIKQLLWTVALGDFVSLYTAFLNGTSPIDVGEKDIIERFKAELNS